MTADAAEPVAVAFEGVAVVDPVGGRTTPGQRVLVRGDRIVEVSPADAAGQVVADRTIEGTGLFLLPGLVDAHVHVTAATADLAALTEWSPAYVTAHAATILRGMLDRGFTTVRDVGGADYGLARAVEERLLEGPRIIHGGKALSQTGGHADMRAPGRHLHAGGPCCPGLGIVVDGVDEVRRAAREQLRTGAGHLKLMLSGGVASPTDRIGSTQFSTDEIRAAVDEAGAANRYVTGHAYTARAVNRALTAGVRCIEHGNLVDESSLELFLQHDAFLVPTLVTYAALQDEGPRHGLPADSHGKVSAVLDAGLSALAAADRAGVRIAFGTDLLGGMHGRQSEEFSLRAQVQDPAALLRSATTTAADLLGLGGEIGVVAAGARADLLLVDHDPLAHIDVLADPARHVRFVMADGVVCRDRLSETAEAAASR